MMAPMEHAKLYMHVSGYASMLSCLQRSLDDAIASQVVFKPQAELRVREMLWMFEAHRPLSIVREATAEVWMRSL